MKHETKVFHVQTEDRGLANPVVESLVYVGGEILLSKKSPYKDLITGDRVDEKALREMMDLQHRRVIEAVRRGRLDTGKIGDAPADWADDTLPHPDKVSPAALAAVSAILSAPPEPFPGDRRRVTTSAAMPVVAPPSPRVPAAPPAAPPQAAASAPAPARPAAPAPAPSAPPAAAAPAPPRAAAPAPAALDRLRAPHPRLRARRSRNREPGSAHSTRSSSTISRPRPPPSTSRSRSRRTAISCPEKRSRSP